MIEKIRLNNFRNFKNNLFNFSDKTTVIIGPNASGKSNILESLYLLSTGKSFRVRVEEEMINYSTEIARVKGRLTDGLNSDHLDLEAMFTRGEITIGEDPKRMEKAPRKKLFVNGVSRRLFNFAGNFKVVLFGPWDLDIVTESPSVRRRFLDSVLSQVEREYRRASMSYEKGLRQRNKLLLRIRDEGVPKSQLLFWNKLLIKNGDYISAKRQEFIDFVNETQDFNKQDFSLEYDKSAISEARLEQYEDEEVSAATTLVGPHRDDFCFFLRKNNRKHSTNNTGRRDLARFGSRGEQRMGVLWLKLAELSFIEKTTGERPTLLLDDIFSELDHEHRDIVVDVVGGQQTIITTADPHFVAEIKRVEKVKL
jgi:DNA replication and repair protein RecF